MDIPVSPFGLPALDSRCVEFLDVSPATCSVARAEMRLSASARFAFSQTSVIIFVPSPSGDPARMISRHLSLLSDAEVLLGLRLAAIHAAYVRHGDVAGRNVLVLPQGRVLWIDFDQALCGEGEGEREREQLSRQALLRELEGSWTLCYVSYVSAISVSSQIELYLTYSSSQTKGSDSSTGSTEFGSVRLL